MIRDVDCRCTKYMVVARRKISQFGSLYKCGDKSSLKPIFARANTPGFLSDFLYEFCDVSNLMPS